MELLIDKLQIAQHGLQLPPRPVMDRSSDKPMRVWASTHARLAQLAAHYGITVVDLVDRLAYAQDSLLDAFLRDGVGEVEEIELPTDGDDVGQFLADHCYKAKGQTRTNDLYTAYANDRYDMEIMSGHDFNSRLAALGYAVDRRRGIVHGLSIKPASTHLLVSGE
jgi:hypothetical protein